MGNIDYKVIYTLFCNNGLLEYLDIKDKVEFSLTYFYKYTEKINTRDKPPEEVYNYQLEYLDNIINKCKPNLLSLVCSRVDNYYILEYFSICFNNLSSLCLSDLFIPKETFKNLILNLVSIHSLELLKIGVVFNKNDQSKIQLNFPKYLNKLVAINCFQLNYDFKDPIDLKISGVLTTNMNRKYLDISDSIINNITHLTWSNPYERSINNLNILLSNNIKLTTLEAPLENLNFESLSLISNNRNLVRLNLSCSKDTVCDNIRFHIFMFIKAIEFKSVFGTGIKSVNELIQNCPNLEELKYNLTLEYNDHMRDIIKNSQNLKKLHIIHINLEQILSAPLPYSNLEHLELTLQSTLIVNLNIFNNLKRLKSIKINGLSKHNNFFSDTSQLYDGFYYWRKISYNSSVTYWKII